MDFRSTRMHCGFGESPSPTYRRCGSLYCGSSGFSYFCAIHCSTSSTRNTFRRREQIACFTTSALNTASYTVHGAPFLSSSLRASDTESGNRRCCVASGSSRFASAFSTASGTTPLAQSEPGAWILKCPQTLMKTLRPVSSTVFTTKPGSGKISSRSAGNAEGPRRAPREEGSPIDPTIRSTALVPPPRPSSPPASICFSAPTPPAPSASDFRTGPSSGGAWSGSRLPPMAVYCCKKAKNSSADAGPPSPSAAGAPRPSAPNPGPLGEADPDPPPSISPTSRSIATRAGVPGDARLRLRPIARDRGKICDDVDR